MRITALTIHNFKGLRSVSVDCDRELVILAGRNGAGKSSALDAITVLLMGKSAMPAEPIRRGEDEGEISAVIDGFTVKRTFTRKDDGSFGGTLTITNADGMRAPSPQTWLDARINALGCDPIAFMASKPSEQAETLRKIAGVDTTALDQKRAALEQERLIIGRDGKVAAADVVGQTKQAFENVRAVLEAGGCRWRDVVRLQTFLVSADDIPGFMKARQEVFPGWFPDGAYPPNTLLVVSRLVRPELRVEIEAMAVRRRAVARRKPARPRKSRRQR